MEGAILFTRKEPSEAEKLLDGLIEDALRSTSPYDDDISKDIKNIEKLMKLRDRNKPKPISKDTFLVVGGNLLGIAMIVGHERANVVTSKALQFLKTLR